MPGWRKRRSITKDVKENPFQRNSRQFRNWNTAIQSDSDDSDNEVKVSYQQFDPMIEGYESNVSKRQKHNITTEQEDNVERNNHLNTENNEQIGQRKTRNSRNATNYPSQDVEMAIADSDESENEVNVSVGRRHYVSPQKSNMKPPRVVSPSPSPSPPRTRSPVGPVRLSNVGRRLNFEDEDLMDKQFDGDENAQPSIEKETKRTSNISRRHSLFSPQTKELMGMRIFPASAELEEEETNNSTEINNSIDINNNSNVEANDNEDEKNDDFNLYFPQNETKQRTQQIHRRRNVSSVRTAHPATASYLRPSSNRSSFIERIENQELEEDIDSFSDESDNNNNNNNNDLYSIQRQEQLQQQIQPNSNSDAYPSNTGNWTSFQDIQIDDDDDDEELPPVPLPSRKSPLTPSPSKNSNTDIHSILRGTQNRSPASNRYSISKRSKSMRESPLGKRYLNSITQDSHNDNNQSYTEKSPQRQEHLSDGGTINEPPYKRLRAAESIIHGSSFVEDIDEDSQFDVNNNEKTKSPTHVNAATPKSTNSTLLSTSLTTPPSQSGTDWINSVRNEAQRSLTPQKSKFKHKRSSRRGNSSFYAEMLQNELTAITNDHHRRQNYGPENAKTFAAQLDSGSSPSESQTSASSSHSAILERDSIAVRILQEKHHDTLIATLCRIVGSDNNENSNTEENDEHDKRSLSHSFVDVYFTAENYEENNFGIGAVVRIFRPFQEYPASPLFPRSVIFCTITTELEKKSLVYSTESNNNNNNNNNYIISQTNNSETSSLTGDDDVVISDLEEFNRLYCPHQYRNQGISQLGLS